ncbi:DUF1127 domain-containing protein [Roseateles sp.]|uniref:DUF1127 domain-containing protein n=1 Tax=Roseateles sp. TaxID=1971397 RepID=UPI00286B2E53|nr:DUF1127 domain-containing protein [Roseateles sp.]
MHLANITRTYLQTRFAGWQQRRRHARMRAELRGLDDRELLDLGLGRGELEYLLKQA